MGLRHARRKLKSACWHGSIGQHFDLAERRANRKVDGAVLAVMCLHSVAVIRYPLKAERILE